MSELWWVWREDPDWLAYDNEYPCVSPGGDPLVLGEPILSAKTRDEVRAIAGWKVRIVWKHPRGIEP